MYEFIMFGSLAFWGYLFFLSIVLLIFVAHDGGVGATFVLIIGMLLFWLLSKINPFLFLIENWFIVVFYIPLGVLWSLKKWRDRVLKMRDDYGKAKLKYFESHGYSPSSEEGLAKWKEKLRSKIKSKTSFKIPKVSEHKNDIFCWITYWPFSVIWYFCDDLLVELYNRIFNFLKVIYQSITDKVLKDIKSDFEE